MPARKPPILGKPDQERTRACARSKQGFGGFGLQEAFFAVRGRISSTATHSPSFPPMAGSPDGVSVAPPVRPCRGRSVHAILPDRGGARSGRRDGCSPRPSTAPSSARSRRARRKEPCRDSGARDRYPRFRRRAQAAHLRELRAPLARLVFLARSAFLRKRGAVEQLLETLPVLGAAKLRSRPTARRSGNFFLAFLTGGADRSTSVP